VVSKIKGIVASRLPEVNPSLYKKPRGLSTGLFAGGESAFHFLLFSFYLVNYTIQCVVKRFFERFTG